MYIWIFYLFISILLHNCEPTSCTFGFEAMELKGFELSGKHAVRQSYPVE